MSDPDLIGKLVIERRGTQVFVVLHLASEHAAIETYDGLIKQACGGLVVLELGTEYR